MTDNNPSRDEFLTIRDLLNTIARAVPGRWLVGSDGVLRHADEPLEPRTLADVIAAAEAEPLAEWEREYLTRSESISALLAAMDSKEKSVWNVCSEGHLSRSETDARWRDDVEKAIRINVECADALTRINGTLDSLADAVAAQAARGVRAKGRHRGPFDDGDRVEVWIGGTRVYLGRIERPSPNDFGADS